MNLCESNRGLNVPGLLGGLLMLLALMPLRSLAEEVDRTALPIPDPVSPPITELDARDAKAPKPTALTAPKGAPNVVIVLLDDLGFGGPSTFGGPIQMPTLDSLAESGLRYNNFHTTALCSPTRAALKSGRNHHTVNMGSISETATAFPGNTGQIPNNAASLAEILRLNGYSTAAFGKWHETAAWETSVSGPFFRWPTQQGFDKFYGFIGGETNQYSPMLYDGTARVEIPEDPGYHLTEDLTNQAINWMRFQHAMTPEKPIFVYFATGAVHAPHHISPEWADRYKGQFDQGWDAVRQATLARQIELGVVPEGTQLASKPEAIKDWNRLSDEERRLFTRQAEFFAGFTEHTDRQVGRLVEALREMDELDNTLFIYIAGDNGTSAEGGMNGMFNEMTYFNGIEETVPDMLARIGEWGGPNTFPHMSAGWAVAFNAPFMWTKQVASNFGGTRNGMVIHWPKGIRDKNEVRTQFHHVIDVAPTVLDAAALPEPKTVNGVTQTPMEGVSMLYSFDHPNAEDRHKTQYFEIIGNRAIYHDGWLAGVVHKAPWEAEPRRPLAEESKGTGWELYNIREDFSLNRDLAASNPEKLKEMQARFMEEAARYHALPIDDRSIERFDPVRAGRPDLMGSRTSLTLYEGMDGMMENTFLNVKNRSSGIIAEVDIPEGGANGVILAQGGRFGGWALYMKDGKPAYTYNWLGLKSDTIMASEPLPAGKATITFDFDYDGGGLGKGGNGKIRVNGKTVAEGRIEQTQSNMFSLDESADVGVDEATPVVEGIGEGQATRFTGTINQVTLELR